MSLTRPRHEVQLRSPRVRDAGWAVLWIVALGAAEIVGRNMRHELADIALVLALLALGMVTRTAGRVQTIAWWAAAGDRIAGLLAGRKGMWGSCGIDLRGGCTLRRGLPPPRMALSLTAAALLVPAVAAAPHLPDGLRTLGLASSYVGYLALLAVIWVASTGALLGFTFFAAGIVGDARIRRADNAGRPRSGRSPSRRAFATPLVAALVLSLSPIPPLVPACGILGCLLATALVAAQPRLRDVRVIWRRAGGEPRVASLGAHLVVEASVAVLVSFLLVTLATGLATETDPDALRVTASLGTSAAWAVTFGLGALAWRLAALIGSAASCDPAAPGAPVVHLVATTDAATLAAVAAAGWSIREAGASPAPGEVAADPSTRDLTTEAGLAWLRRRHEIVQRRLLRRGLQRLLRAAARFDYARGTGTLIALHLWAVPALARDQDEEDSIEKGTGAIDQVLGPDHAHAFPASARAHARDVFGACDIDLLFVEDGVTWKQLKRVLGVVFEVFDVHGGTRRVEDRDFSGLTGLRVAVHEYDLDNPYRAEGYPEPDYDDVARARILHVFRDRGGEPERVSAPAPGDRVPLLV